MTTRNILITGSSGMLGTRLCERLIERGHLVVGVDWKANRWNSTVNQTMINIDLRDGNQVLKKLPRKVDVVVHLAANARVYDSVKNPALARDNIKTTFNVFEYARMRSLPRLIFASSREVYGNSAQIVRNENDVPIEMCESIYAASKLSGESFAHAYSKCYGLNFTILRLSNVYGMYDISDRLVPTAIKSFAESKDVTIFGKAKMLDFTYIDDAVSGITETIENLVATKNEVINIASGEGTSILEVVNKLREKMYTTSKLRFKKSRKGEVFKYVADISKARELLNYKPQYSLSEGIDDTLNWYKQNTKYRIKILK